MEKFVSIDYIDPSPFQAREDNDAFVDHIWEVAQSIAKNGLMQVPVGRLVDKDGKPDKAGDDPIMVLLAAGWRVQLAFGNTRRAAYRLLRNSLSDTTVTPVHSSINPEENWQLMPVNILELTDQQMFEMGIEENLARKQLNAIEEAHAMIRYREVFGKTSEEIGKLFHMTDSSVRNKMRLLRLPPSIQWSLKQGEIPEGVARELLALVELPEDIRLKAEDQDEYIKPSEIIEAAKSGAGQKAINEMVTRFMEHIGKRAAPAVTGPTGPTGPAQAPALETFQPGRPVIEQPAPEWPKPPMQAAMAAAAEPARPAAVPDPEVWSQPDPAEQVPDPRYSRAAAPVQDEEPAASEPESDSSDSEPEVLADEQAPEPAPAAPVAAPVPAPTWEGSTIGLTITYWPDDGNPDGRMVMAGVRVDQLAPTMRMFREHQLTIGDQLADLLEELKTKHFGGAL